MNPLKIAPFFVLLAACTKMVALSGPTPAAAPPLPLSAWSHTGDEPSSSNALAGSYKDIVPLALRWDPPLISDFSDTLAPGVVAFWVPDSQLPLTSVQFLWPEGAIQAPKSDRLAWETLGSALRKAGAGSRTGPQLDDTLEFLSASVSASVGEVKSQAQVQGLTRDIPFLLTVLEDMLVHPRLEESRLAPLRAETRQAIDHQTDAPAQTLGLSWDLVSNGPSAWTFQADSSQVRSLTAYNYRRVLEGRFATRPLWISIAGKFDRVALRKAIMDLVHRLPNGKTQQALPGLPALPPPGTYLYDIESNQAFITMGARFVRRDHPDYYPLMLASQVLGQGGFGTRLVDKIRSDEGLAYHVTSFAGSDYQKEAMWGVSLQTKLASTGRAILLARQEIQKLADSGFAPGELAKARQGLAAGIPSLFDTPENTADMLLESAANGRRNDHFRLYRKALDSIPDSTVLRVFRKWFQPDSLRVVISGPAKVLTAPFADGSPAFSHWGPVFQLEKADFGRIEGAFPLHRYISTPEIQKE